MSKDITLRKAPTTSDEMHDARIKELDGGYVYGSNHCLEHGISMALIVRNPGEVDPQCVLEALDDLKRTLIRSMIEQGVFIAIPVQVTRPHPPPPAHKPGEQM